MINNSRIIILDFLSARHHAMAYRRNRSFFISPVPGWGYADKFREGFIKGRFAVKAHGKTD